MAGATVAIVATVRDPGPTFRTWIAYHLQVVDRLYIFLDKPGTGDEQLIPDHPRVVAVAGEQRSALSGPNGVMQRQAANASRALALCARDGIDWLLHIDADELIWAPEKSFKAFLADLDPEVSLAVFANHELVNRFEDAGDFFREMHLFKRNGHEFPQGHWMHARKYEFFRLYQNGKAAVRVAMHNQPDGVHLFNVKGGRMHVETGASVLHYPVATYRDWLKKHEQLGDFLPYWWDNPATPMDLPYLVDSRDAYLESVRKGDPGIAERWYRTTLFTEEEVRELIDAGAVFRADPLQGVIP